MSTPRTDRVLRVTAAVGFSGLVAVALLIWLGGDRWWLALPVLYGPRLGAVVLIIPVLLLAIKAPSRGSLAWLLLSVLLLSWGILGFRVGTSRLSSGDGATIRVASYNVAGRMTAADRFLRELDAEQVTLAILVECPSGLSAPQEWYLSRVGELCLLGRDSLPGAIAAAEGSEDGAAIGRVDVQLNGHRIRVGLVHLGSPHGIAMMFNDKSEILTLGPMVRESTRQREQDSNIAAQFIAEDAGDLVLVAGDFNLPVESAIYRQYWSGYTNAFDAGGIGLGSSWVAGVYRIRIDHIIHSHGIRTLRSWVGPDWGSDHLPLFADLKLPEEP